MPEHAGQHGPPVPRQARVQCNVVVRLLSVPVPTAASIQRSLRALCGPGFPPLFAVAPVLPLAEYGLCAVFASEFFVA